MISNLSPEEKAWWDKNINRALRRQRRQNKWNLVKAIIFWTGLAVVAIGVMATCSQMVAPRGVITVKVDTSSFSEQHQPQPR
jgi:hypothetical protein